MKAGRQSASGVGQLKRGSGYTYSVSCIYKQLHKHELIFGITVSSASLVENMNNKQEMNL